MSQTGRPTVLDEVKRREICALYYAGISTRAIAKYVGCSPSTISNTAARDPEFACTIRNAFMRRELSLLMNIQNASPKQWRASAWMLERLYPDRYGPHVTKGTSAEQKVAWQAAIIAAAKDSIPPEFVGAFEARMSEIHSQLDVNDLDRALGLSPPISSSSSNSSRVDSTEHGEAVRPPPAASNPQPSTPSNASSIEDEDDDEDDDDEKGKQDKGMPCRPDHSAITATALLLLLLSLFFLLGAPHPANARNGDDATERVGDEAGASTSNIAIDLCPLVATPTPSTSWTQTQYVPPWCPKTRHGPRLSRIPLDW